MSLSPDWDFSAKEHPIHQDCNNARLAYWVGWRAVLAKEAGVGNLSSTAKIASSIVLVLINSPLVVALVLVFKPASFASFKNPVPGAVVKEASASKS